MWQCLWDPGRAGTIPIHYGRDGWAFLCSKTPAKGSPRTPDLLPAVLCVSVPPWPPSCHILCILMVTRAEIYGIHILLSCRKMERTRFTIPPGKAGKGGPRSLGGVWEGVWDTDKHLFGSGLGKVGPGTLPPPTPCMLLPEPSLLSKVHWSVELQVTKTHAGPTHHQLGIPRKG